MCESNICRASLIHPTRQISLVAGGAGFADKDLWTSEIIVREPLPWHCILEPDTVASSSMAASPYFNGDESKELSYKADHMETYNSFGLEWPPEFDAGVAHNVPVMRFPTATSIGPLLNLLPHILRVPS